MEKAELDARITQAARSIFNWCLSRTRNSWEAEDLAQEIILEVWRGAPNIRDDEAFYGFLWAVAENVRRQWYKKRARMDECELTDEVQEALPESDDTDVYILRRELTLLAEKYRRVAILYYVDGLSCAQIAEKLNISENMVKYLLFKARQILKEGMTMERNYGEQSYNPRKLQLLFWGNGANRYYRLCDSRVSQNILFACYNDKLSPEQISLEIGVALPYMEDQLKELLEYDLLKQDGNRCYTNIPIFTKEFTVEVNRKTAGLRGEIADIVEQTINEREADIRAVGFAGADMERGSLRWQIGCMLLYRAIIDRLQARVQLIYPVDKFGTACFIWGSESFEEDNWSREFGFGISNVSNAAGDHMQFMDFPINGEMVHHYFYNRQSVANVFLDIARGHTAHFSQNDLAAAADMVKQGYVVSEAGELRVNAPVFTQAQFAGLSQLLDEPTEAIAGKAEALMNAVAQILKNHMPAHLKKCAPEMAYLRLFEDAISAPTELLCGRGYLQPCRGGGMLPTTYVILA